MRIPAVVSVLMVLVPSILYAQEAGPPSEMAPDSAAAVLNILQFSQDNLFRDERWSLSKSAYRYVPNRQQTHGAVVQKIRDGYLVRYIVNGKDQVRKLTLPKGMLSHVKPPFTTTTGEVVTRIGTTNVMAVFLHEPGSQRTLDISLDSRVGDGEAGEGCTAFVDPAYELGMQGFNFKKRPPVETPCAKIVSNPSKDAQVAEGSGADGSVSTTASAAGAAGLCVNSSTGDVEGCWGR